LRLRILSVWVLAGLVLSSCIAVPTRPPENPAFVRAYQLRFEHLRPLNHWAVDGRIAISNGKDGGSGNLSWLHDDRVTRMSFRGVLGRGAWQIQADTSGARLELASGEVRHASSIAELVRKQIGWKIPVDALSWWIKGLAQPDKWETRTLDEKGRLKSLQQFGWHVDFDKYGEPDSYWLPAKLTARRDNYSVKMIVRKWHLGEEATVLE